MRSVVLAICLTACAALVVPARPAGAQYAPGYPYAPGPAAGYASPPGPSPVAGPGYAAAPYPTALDTSDSSACRRDIMQAANPVANQIIYYTWLGNIQPTGPLGRPPLLPAPAYPGFGAIYGTGGPEFQFANGILAGSLRGLPPGALPSGPVDLIGNGFAAANLRQSAISNNLAAATANEGFALYPRVQADFLNRVMTSLLTYYDIACPLFAEQPATPAASSDGAVSGSDDALRQMIRQEIQRAAEEIIRRMGPPR